MMFARDKVGNNDISKPLVSIIIPSYNSMSGTKNIAKTLVSISQQTYNNLEVLVIDSFSHDETFEVCKKYPVRFFRLSGSRSRARNYGIMKMCGSYALFVDSDHVLAPDLVEQCMEKVLRYGVEVILIPVIFVSSRKARINCSRMRNLEFKLKRGMQTFILFYSRKCIQDVVFPESVEVGEDMIFSGKVLLKKPLVARIKSVIYHLEEGTTRYLVLRSWNYGKKFRSTISEIGTRNSTRYIQSLSPLNIGKLPDIVLLVSDAPSTVFYFAFYTALKHLSFAISFCLSSLMQIMFKKRTSNIR